MVFGPHWPVFDRLTAGGFDGLTAGRLRVRDRASRVASGVGEGAHGVVKRQPHVGSVKT